MRSALLVLIGLVLASSDARAEGSFVFTSGLGAGWGLAVPKPRGHLLLRAETDLGFVDTESGAGLLIGGALTADLGSGIAFDEGARAELSVRLLTGKGTFRFFGGRLLTGPGGHGGVAYGLTIPVTPASPRGLLTPELGLRIERGHESDDRALVTLQLAGDWFWVGP